MICFKFTLSVVYRLERWKVERVQFSRDWTKECFAHRAHECSQFIIIIFFFENVFLTIKIT